MLTLVTTDANGHQIRTPWGGPSASEDMARAMERMRRRRAPPPSHDSHQATHSSVMVRYRERHGL